MEFRKLEWDLIKFKMFLKDNNRYPNIYSIDKQERKYANWYRNICNIIVRGQMNADGSITYRDKTLPKEFIDEIKESGLNIKSTEYKDKWYETFTKFKKFVAENNRYPRLGGPNGENELANWSVLQRTICNHGTKQRDGSLKYGTNVLTKEELDDLNKFGFKLKSPTYDEKWFKNYNALTSFIKENNRFPSLSEEASDYEKKLAIWKNRINSIYNNGTKDENGDIRYGTSVLQSDKIELLIKSNIITAVSELPKVRVETWYDNFEKYLEFIKTHNREPRMCNDLNERSIASWGILQRGIYKKGIRQEDGSLKYGTNILTPDEIKALKDNNFNFESKTKDDKWNAKFDELKKFLETHHRYPSDKIFAERPLYLWISNQRTVHNLGYVNDDGNLQYKTAILTPDRIEKLHSIDFKFILDENRFQHNKWKDRNTYLAKLRYLKSKLEILTEKEKEFKSKDDIKKLNEDFCKELNKTKKA